MRPQNEELMTIRQKARTRSAEILDRNLAETDLEIKFLEAQIEVDLESLSLEALERGRDRILFLKEKMEIIKFELENRDQSTYGTKTFPA